MSAAEAVPVVMDEISEPLTWVEICARYPDEWVCLAEMERSHRYDPEIRSARVIGHGKTRGEPVEQVLRMRRHYDLVGHYYTGRVTERPLRTSLIVNDETRDALR